MFLSAVGEQILTYRETASLSQQELAARAGVTIQELDEIEHGWRDVRLTVLQALADGLGASVAELLDVDGSELGSAAKAAASKGHL